ncbi:MAG: UDP-4-amino-4-deoxy-L-arabinose--oxoglutarate aminotransferase [Chlamydiae bacterium]|nr:UDP-4-amino-4-deoxy-L-arabinose--oxoglutarate aminotransferase [Chlamydiota bacterium]
MKCRHCQHKTLSFLNLGFSPLANDYLTSEDLNSPETTYPLVLRVCNNCFLVQVQDSFPINKLFPEDYAYFSATSISWLLHSKDFSVMITEKLNLNNNSLVIEVGSNDGYLLRNFVNKNIPCIGIEPSSDTARESNKFGIKTVEKFFNTELAKTLPKADLVIGNNVYAHVPDINDFSVALKTILKEEGTITLEFPHLLKFIQELQFDTAYHEHFFYLSLHTVIKIFDSSGLKVYNVEELATHGGSIRIYGCHKESKKKVSESVHTMLQQEKEFGILNIATYFDFKNEVEQIRNKFLSFMVKAKNSSKKIVAYGAAAKGNTFLNFAGIKHDFIQTIYDQAKSKQNKYLPGSHIPIENPNNIDPEKFDYILILPWNIQEEVHKFLVSKGIPEEKIIVFYPRNKNKFYHNLLTKTNKENFPVFKPLIEKEEINAAVQSLEIGWLGMGASVGQFETAILSQIQSKNRFAVAVSTGHAALHLAMHLINVQPGDEIITPSFNNIADFQAIAAMGAKPVFCDILNETLCIDASKIEPLITSRTKAIIIMDYACFLADHDKINQLATKYKLRVIHDAAHSFGSYYKGKPVGSFSDITMFSFDPVKTITCIDGGALIVNSKKDLELLQRMRLIGMNQSPKLMYENQRAWTYDVSHLGFRYHLANLHAAIGCAQIKKLDSIISHRRASCKLYNQLLSDNPHLQTPESDFEHIAPFIYFVRVCAESRDGLKEYLMSKSIHTGIHWQPGHFFSFFKDCAKGDLSVTESISKEILTLPLYSDITKNAIIHICNQINSFFSKIKTPPLMLSI